jgi:lipid-A-disaccharide synthase
MYGAALIRAIRKIVPDAVFRGFGGPAMREAGMEIVLDLTQYDVMWAKAFRHVRELAGVLAEAERGFASAPPDVVVPIDYPGFNLRLAARARGKGVPVCYYISPQVWAWWRGRIRRIGRCVDRMMVIFPFEEPIYRDAGIPCTCVGHPLIGRMAETPPDEERVAGLRAGAEGNVLVGLLPGSRPQELRRHLPVMLGAVERVLAAAPDTRFVLPCRTAEHGALAEALLGPMRDRVRRVDGGVRETMKAADLCVTSSGTTTVELMVYGTPMVVMYRVPPLQYLAACLFMRVPHITMVNILAGREAVPEHLMCRARSADLAASVLPLVRDPERRRAMRADLGEIRAGLGGPEASDRAARTVVEACRGARGGAPEAT